MSYEVPLMKYRVIVVILMVIMATVTAGSFLASAQEDTGTTAPYLCIVDDGEKRIVVRQEEPCRSEEHGVQVSQHEQTDSGSPALGSQAAPALVLPRAGAACSDRDAESCQLVSPADALLTVGGGQTNPSIGDTLPASCQAIRDANPVAGDGEYIIYPNGRTLQVYCHDMAGQPKEYLSLLNTGGDFNFSQYTAGGASPGTNVRTNYTKVRMNPETLMVDVGNQTFATSMGELTHGTPVTEIAYGSALDCIGLNSHTGLGNIDLRGTPFVISDTFGLGGWYPAGQANFSSRDQVVNLQGGGYCGIIGPSPLDQDKTIWPVSGDFRLDLRYVGILHVDADASGADDGSSWTDAYNDLQDALAIAVPGSEIWVAEGRYTPGEVADESFYLLEDVAIYGGFAGWETQRSQRDWQNNVTVLSGDLAGDDITDVNGVITNTANISGTNAYHVVRSNYLTENAVLDGFTITGGAALSNSWPNYMGGGMSNDQSRPTLANLVFRGNMASVYGGGLYNNVSSPTLYIVTFRDNAAVGSIAMGADGYGGGMYNNAGSSPTLEDVTFLDNSAAGYGGGLRNWYQSNPTLINVTFEGNSAGIYAGGLGNRSNSRPTLIDVTFIDNTASLGGGMANQENSSTNMANVMFNGNSADYGGGMYTEGLNYVSVVKMTNAVFSGNRAEYDGGAIENRGSLLELRQVTLANNQAQGNGGGLNIFATAVPSLTIDIYNSIFWGNTAAAGAQLFNADPAALASLDHVLIQDGCPADVSCSSYVVADPLFMDAVGPDGLAGTWDDDLRLQALSPAVDTGDDSLVPVDELDLDADGVTDGELLPVDLLGYSRIYGISVDMGACERQEFYQLLPVILK